MNCYKIGSRNVRRKSMKLLAIAAFSLCTVMTTPASAGMEVQQTNGDVVDLDSYRGDGKWLLVMFWSITCHICEVQKPEISAFHERHRDIDAQVVGIAIDGMEKVDAIRDNMEHNQTSFPTLVGNIAIVASHYKAMTDESFRGTPTYLLFNPEGELMGNNPGPLSTEAIEKFISRKTG